MSIDAMSSTFYCDDCDKCAYTDKDGVVHGGRYRVHNRRASRRNALRDGFGLSYDEADAVVLDRDDVKAFYELLVGYDEQLWPRRCCDACEKCAEADRRFRVSAGMKLHKKFVKLLRACGFDVGFLTLTMPSVAPRPEHISSFMDSDIHSEYRESWVRKRVFERVKRRVKTYAENLVGYESGSEFTVAVLRACAVLHEHGIFKTQDSMAAASEELDAALAAGGESPELRVLVLRLQAWRVLSAWVRSQLELELASEEKVYGLETSVFGGFQVHAWQQGWLQSVCGRGRYHDKSVPIFYIPRFGKERFTYKGSPDGRPRCELSWFRNRKNESHPNHQGFVPDDSLVFRPSRALFNHLFGNFKKRLAARGIQFFYLGTEEHGSVHSDTDRWFNSEMHFHLHLLINLPLGSRNAKERRALFRQLWHNQTGNIYWGRKRAKRVKVCPIANDPFCSRLVDDDAVCHYSSKYLTKEAGRIRTSQELGLHRSLFEDTVLSFDAELSASVSALPTYGMVSGRPQCLQRLDDDVLYHRDITEWVGLSQEQRRIGKKPVHVASATSLPSPSIHRAGGLKVSFSREDSERGIVPFAYWVPKSVWVSAQDNPLSEAAVRLRECIDTWAESVDEILLPP